MLYDELNRMISYTGPRGSESFAYRGAEWHRHSQTHNGATTGFFYDGDNVAADVAAGSVTRSYVTPFLDQNLSFTAGASTYYYSHDGLGSVRTVTADDGDVANRYDYLPFGKAYGRGTSASVTQRYTFTGREGNPASALMYYRYRECSPRLGSMLHRNPWGYTHRNCTLYDAMNANAILYTEPFSKPESEKTKPSKDDEAGPCPPAQSEDPTPSVPGISPVPGVPGMPAVVDPAGADHSLPLNEQGYPQVDPAAVAQFAQNLADALTSPGPTKSEKTHCRPLKNPRGDRTVPLNTRAHSKDAKWKKVGPCGPGEGGAGLWAKYCIETWVCTKKGYWGTAWMTRTHPVWRRLPRDQWDCKCVCLDRPTG
jgi:hypothetical protein